MPHRYFTTEISDGTATLRGADAHHLARVMRARLGDTVILCDGNAVEYTATITGFGDECVEFRVEPGYPSAAEPSVEVTLLAGYPKQDKLEQIIKHGVELGAAHIVPFFSRYCVAAPKKEEQKNERYNRIAVEAAKQCGRGPAEHHCSRCNECCWYRAVRFLRIRLDRCSYLYRWYALHDVPGQISAPEQTTRC